MIRVYRGYSTSDSWTHWAVSRDAALTYLQDQYGPLTLSSESQGVEVWENKKDGGEYQIDHEEIDTTPEGLVAFLNELDEL